MKTIFNLTVIGVLAWNFLPGEMTRPVRRLFWFGYPITLSTPEVLGQQLSHTTWTTSGHDVVFGVFEKLEPSFEKRVLVCPEDVEKLLRDYTYECDPRESYKLTKAEHQQLLEQVQVEQPTPVERASSWFNFGR